MEKFGKIFFFPFYELVYDRAEGSYLCRKFVSLCGHITRAIYMIPKQYYF